MSHHVTTWSKENVTWPVASVPSFMVIGLVEIKLFFTLSSDITWPYYQIDMWLGKKKPLSLSHHCDMFDAYRSCGKRDIVFLILSREITWPHDQTDMWFAKSKSLSQSHHCAMFDGYRSCRSKVTSGFFLSCDITWPDDQSYIWLGNWKPLTLSRLPFRFGGCRSYRSRDLMVLIPYVTQILFKKFAHRFHIKKQLLE